MTHLHVDLETRSSVDIKTAGMYKYVQSPDFEILLLAHKWEDCKTYVKDIRELKKNDPLDELNIMRKMLKDPTIIKHAYNAAFEWYCLNMAGFETPLDQWQDTMAHALYCGYAAGLEATGTAIGLPQDKQKLASGKALIRYFCKPAAPTKSNGGRMWNEPHHDPDKWADFKAYCIQDVEAEYAIQQRLDRVPMPEEEINLWRQDVLMNARGVRCDRELVEGALHCDNIINARLVEEAISITGLNNPNSNNQLLGWLSAMGFPLEDMTKATVAKALEGDLPDNIRRVLEIRQQTGKTSVKKYKTMQEMLGKDDRIRGLTQYYGASRTGRYSGRGVQMQNLPRNYIGSLDEARKLVKGGAVEAVRMIYGNVPDTLSQLIRTAFVPSPGNKLVVADFSAIEARVIAWLAGETWVNEVFATHGKIYEATAAQMFRVPIETIAKGKENYDLRQKGKVASLALGYQGGTAALTAMGALNMGIPESDLPDIVRMWREANPNIVALWSEVETAMVETVRTGQLHGLHGGLLTFALEGDVLYGQRFMTIKLPSGRKLFYANPSIKENRFGKPAVHFYETDTANKWSESSTYGGRCTENCIAEGSMVITSNGRKCIEDVTTDDLLWDGVEWVSHEGLIDRGVQDVICVDGVYMTPDHLVLTESGWQYASQSERYYRNGVRVPDGDQICGLGRKEVTVDGSLCLRERVCDARIGAHEGEGEVLRVQEERTAVGEKQNARDDQHKNMGGVAFDERAVSHADRAGVEELRGTRDHGMREVETQLREFSGGHGSDVPGGAGTGSSGQQQGVLTGELPMGETESQCKKQAYQRLHKHAEGANDDSRGIGNVRRGCDDDLLPDAARLAGRYVVDKARFQKRVYDIRNCGPRHRFTLSSSAGLMVVHNCVQAIARDCLAVSLNRITAKGWNVVFHVHDEVVIDAPMDVTVDEVCDLMSEPIPWAPGLILKAAGFEADYYKKD